MKILQVCHSTQKSKDWVAEADKRLLRKNGHRVISGGQDNQNRDGNKNYSPIIQNYHLLGKTYWREQSCFPVVQLIQKHRPNVVHMYNNTSLNLPNLYNVCQKMGIAVIQSLYRYEALCPKSALFYSIKTCILCMKQSLSKGKVQEKCRRDDQSQPLDTTKMIKDHWSQKIYQVDIDYYLVPTEFFREKLIEYGLPDNKVAVKPLFSDEPPYKSKKEEDYVLFLGKLTAENGIPTMLSAWSNIPDIPLKILGDGPLLPDVRKACSGNPNLKFLGWQSREDCTAHLARALLLVFPKESHDPFPSTIIKSYAQGVPVIASDLGGIKHMIIEGTSGYLFPPGDAHILAEKIRWLWENRSILKSMGEKARDEYEKKYTSTKNYQILIDIYRNALSQKKKTKSHHRPQGRYFGKDNMTF